MNEERNNLLNYYEALANENSTIDLTQYERFNVKRGLRNEDGTGVLVGLTKIGEVHGYIMDEGDKIPVEGRLTYRSYNVKDLVTGFQEAGKFGFEETCYLLLFGQLPNEKELKEFMDLLDEYRVLPDNFFEDMILKAPSKDIMNKLARCVLVMYSYDDNPDENQVKDVLLHSIGLIGSLSTMVAYSYHANKHYYENQSLYIHIPPKGLSIAEKFLYMIRPDKKYTQTEAELLDLALVLHAEHGGGNNSAFTAHVVSSSETDTYSAIAAAIGSLKGALHGGANMRVMNMMDDIKTHVEDWESEEELKAYLAKIINKEVNDKSGKIYGMGHAVYTYSDPRAVLLKEKAKVLAEEKGRLKEFELYAAIERLTPEVFKEVKGSDKVLCANVDFYSGFVYNMMDIPRELYTPIFAMSRIVGWCAHRIEEIKNGGRIIRPAYKSVIEKKDYIPMSERE
jgi:citrate synthase